MGEPLNNFTIEFKWRIGQYQSGSLEQYDPVSQKYATRFCSPKELVCSVNGALQELKCHIEPNRSLRLFRTDSMQTEYASPLFAPAGPRERTVGYRLSGESVTINLQDFCDMVLQDNYNDLSGSFYTYKCTRGVESTVCFVDQQRVNEKVVESLDSILRDQLSHPPQARM